MSHSLKPHGLYSPPGSSVQGIFQARILEWVAISFSRDILPLIIYHNYGREAGGESRVMGIQEPSVLFFAASCDCIITLNKIPAGFFFFGGGGRVDRGAWLATVPTGSQRLRYHGSDLAACTESDEPILKFRWKRKGPRVAQNNFKKEKRVGGNSLAAQRLGVGDFTAGARVHFLVGELRSCKLCGTAREKRRKGKQAWGQHCLIQDLL